MRSALQRIGFVAIAILLIGQLANAQEDTPEGEQVSALNGRRTNDRIEAPSLDELLELMREKEAYRKPRAHEEREAERSSAIETIKPISLQQAENEFEARTGSEVASWTLNKLRMKQR